MSLVLVSGVSGYIGAHVALALLEKGYRVRGTVRSLKNPAKVEFLRNLPGAERLELVEGDLHDPPEKWAALAQGCDLCCHVASPFPNSKTKPKSDEEVIRPAVDGTLVVLKGCVQAGIKNIVVTSSFVAIGYGSRENKVFTEQDWLDSDAVPDAYGKSKILAERAAWDFQKSLPEDKRFKLVTVNPSFVVGPSLSSNIGTSQDAMLNFLERRMPMVPELIFPSVDVRDVALAHVVALESVPDGQRLLLNSGNFVFLEVAQLLAAEFNPLGYKIPTSRLPTSMLKVGGVCDKSLGYLATRVGLIEQIDNSATRTLLGFPLRPVNDSLMDMAHASIRLGLAHKTRQYAAKYPDA
eukprot:c45774_g1_i1.p1 GENE.c45774_g1_i1~~c45774_g1_i1.p1  ORF type:complete len:352 (-),score=81.46 c45774_g1_i1:106-1161(-)